MCEPVGDGVVCFVYDFVKLHGWVGQIIVDAIFKSHGRGPIYSPKSWHQFDSS